MHCCPLPLHGTPQCFPEVQGNVGVEWLGHSSSRLRKSVTQELGSQGDQTGFIRKTAARERLPAAMLTRLTTPSSLQEAAEAQLTEYPRSARLKPKNSVTGACGARGPKDVQASRAETVTRFITF